MARLLVHNTAPPLHPTDETINAGMFQIGHVVSIVEDWQTFGTDDIGPHSIVVDLVGALKEDLTHLLENETVQVDKTFIDPNTKAEIKLTETVAVAARMWKIKDLPQLKMVSGAIQLTKGSELAFTQSYFKRTVDVVAIVEAMRAKGEVVK